MSMAACAATSRDQRHMARRSVVGRVRLLNVSGGASEVTAPYAVSIATVSAGYESVSGTFA